MFFAYSTQTVFTSEKDASPNARLNALQLHQLIVGSDCAAFGTYEQIRDLCAFHFENGSDYKTVIKPLIEPLKKALSYFLPSGFCPVHHNNETLQYNFVVQLDIDIKRKGGAKEAQRIMKAIKSLKHLLPFVILAAMSPTGYGLKILVQTNNQDKATHGEAFRQVAAFLANLLQIQKGDIDTLGISQPCFLPNDPNAYFNENFTAFPVKNIAAPVEVKSDLIITENAAKEGIRIVNFLIEKVIDITFEHSEFVSTTASCVNTFGYDDGIHYAHELAKLSPAYDTDSFKAIVSIANSVVKNPERHKKATIGTLIFHAVKHGYKPVFEPNYNTTPKCEIRTMKGEKGQYLTDILNNNGIALTAANIFGRKWIVPTGCGKSYLIAQLAKKYKIVVVCPSILLINQYEKDGAVGFYQDHHNISNSDNFIAVTYASLSYLYQYIDLSEFHLIFDECHIFSSNGYTLKMLREDAKQIEKYASFTQFTATNLTVFDLRLIQPIVQVSIPKTPKRLYIKHFDKDLIYNVAQLMKESMKRGRFPFVLMNDTKDKQKELWASLGLDTKGIVFLHSKEKESLAFKGIIENQMLCAYIMALIATSVLKEGINIKNIVALDFFVVGAFHHTDIEQAISRFRNAYDVACYICKGKESKETIQPFNIDTVAHHIVRRTENRIAERTMEKYDGIELSILKSEEHVSNKINAYPMFLNKYGLFELCKIQLGCMIFEREKSHEHQNDKYQIEKLSKYGFIYQQLGEIGCADGSDTKEERADFVQLCKKIDTEKYEHYINQLSNVPNLDKVLKQKVKDKTLTKQAQTAVSRAQYFSDTFGISASDSASVLARKENEKPGKEMSTGLAVVSNSQFKKLCTRAHVQRCEADDAWVKSDRKKTIFFKAVRHGFKEHATTIYSSEQICSIMLAAIKSDNSIDILALGNTPEKVKSKIFEIVSYFYEVNHIVTREGGKLVRFVKLSKCYTILDSFSIREVLTIQNDVTLPSKATPKKGKQISFIDSFVQSY